MRLTRADAERHAGAKPPVVGHEVSSELITQIATEPETIVDAPLDASAEVRDDRGRRCAEDGVRSRNAGTRDVGSAVSEAESEHAVRHPASTAEVIERIRGERP